MDEEKETCSQGAASDDNFIKLLTWSSVNWLHLADIWFCRLKPCSAGTLFTGLERPIAASLVNPVVVIYVWSAHKRSQSSFFYGYCGSLSFVKTAPDLHFWHWVRAAALSLTGFHLMSHTACKSDQWLLSEHCFLNHAAWQQLGESTLKNIWYHTCWQSK